MQQCDSDVDRVREFAPPFARSLYENWIDRPWEEIRQCVFRPADSKWEIEIPKETILEFGRRMRSLTGSRYGYVGKASVAMDRQKVSREGTNSLHIPFHLVPHSLLPCPNGEMPPELAHCVAMTVGDVFFRIHPAEPSPWMFKDMRNDSSHWPQISDILFAVMTTHAPIHFVWYLVVTPCGVVAMRIDPESKLLHLNAYQEHEAVLNRCKNLKDSLVNRQFTQTELESVLKSFHVKIHFFIDEEVVSDAPTRQYITSDSHVKYLAPSCEEREDRCAPCSNFVRHVLPPNPQEREDVRCGWYDLFMAFYQPCGDEDDGDDEIPTIMRYLRDPKEVRSLGKNKHKMANVLALLHLPSNHVEPMLKSSTLQTITRGTQSH